MKTKKILFPLLLPALAVSFVVDAAEFRPGSVRSLGMGGSNVATTNGVDATYWNPAAYGFFGEDNSGAEMKSVDNNDASDKDFGLDVGAVVGVNLFGPIADNLNTLQNMQVPAGTPGTGLSAAEILAFANFTDDFSSLDPALGGLNVTADATVGARVSNYGLSIHQSFDVNAGVEFDTQNTGLGGNAAVVAAFNGGSSVATTGAAAGLTAAGYFSTAEKTSMNSQLLSAGYSADEAATVIIAYDVAMQAGAVPAGDSATMADALVTIATAPGDLQNNGTTIETRGVSMREIGVTYGYALNESLSVGGVLKQMTAEMVVGSALAFGTTDTLQTLTDSTGTEEVSGMGLDLGVMYRMPDWQFGLTTKNINSPSFDHSSGYTYEMKPQAKVGAAWMPSPEVAVELGLDITENEGVVATTKSQYWNLGVEWDAWEILALRAGAYKNMAQNDVGLVTSVGLGLNLWAMRLDFAYAQSNKKVTVENDELPVYAMASVALAVDF